MFKPQCSLDVRKWFRIPGYRYLEQLVISDIVNACSISVLKHKLEFVDFTPFVRVEFP